MVFAAIQAAAATQQSNVGFYVLVASMFAVSILLLRLALAKDPKDEVRPEDRVE